MGFGEIYKSTYFSSDIYIKASYYKWCNFLQYEHLHYFAKLSQDYICYLIGKAVLVEFLHPVKTRTRALPAILTPFGVTGTSHSAQS